MPTLLNRILPGLGIETSIAQVAAATARNFQTGSVAPEALKISLIKTSLDEFHQLAKSAESTFTGDLFLLSDNKVLAGINALKGRGVTQRFLLDPENAKAIKGQLSRGRELQLRTYGKMPFKNHGKAFVADGQRGLVTTGAFHSKTPDRYEVVAQFEGEAARLLDQALNGAIDGNKALERASLEAARPFGIVYNDPKLGVTTLTDSVYELLDNAQAGSRITVSSKKLEDAGFMRRLKAAQERGAEVLFTDIRAQGAHEGRMHGNLLIVDDAMYLGTAHFSARGMGDTSRSYRRVRDSGLIVRDARQTNQMLANLDEVAMRAWLPDEFARTKAAYAKIDSGRRKLQAKGLTPEVRKQLDDQVAKATVQWRAAKADVSRARDADGITFVRGGQTVS